jgi:hypothetical protein
MTVLAFVIYEATCSTSLLSLSYHAWQSHAWQSCDIMSALVLVAPSIVPVLYSHVPFLLLAQVGEEYLILLPECLPFLSELMEDANRDVVAATAEAIRFIEELSGEKLDEFLQ